MADETKIIQDVSNAVDGLGASFKALSEILSKNIAGQKEQIGYINQLKKALGAKEFKDFVKISTDLSKAQAELAKQQKAALDIAKKDEQLKEQANKTALAATRAAEAEALAQEKLKQAKERSWREEQKSIKEKEKAKRASDEAQSAYRRESDRLLQLTKSAKDAAIQYGINSKEAKKLRNEQQELDKKLKNVDASLGIHNRNVGNYQSALGGAKNLLGQFGIAIGGAQLAMKLFNGVIEAGQAAGDSWAKSVAGWEGALNAFYKTFSSGDWDNLFDNMSRAYETMREAAGIKDDLFEGGLGAKIFEAETNILIQEQENIRKASKQGSDERIAAAKEIIRLNELILKRKEEEIDATVDMNNKTVQGLTKLNADELYAYIKNFREETELREKTIEFLEKEQKLKSQIAAGQDITVSTGGMYGGAQVSRASQKEKEDAIQAEKELTELYKDENLERYRDYATTLDKYKSTDDKMVEDFINAHLAKKEAQLEMMRATARAEQDLIRDSEKEKLDISVQSAKETAALVIEEREEAEDKIPEWIATEIAERQKASDEYRALLEGDTKFLEGQQKERDKITKDGLEKELELRKEINSKTKELFGAATEAYFDIKAEGYERDLEENRKYYDELLSNQLLDEEQRSLLEAQREAKENEIRRKQKENERKEFLFKKFQALGEIAISLAKANAAALVYGPILSPGIILKNKILAALQAGVVMAQMLPMLDKGSKYTPENYVMSEKGPEIHIGKSGKATLVTQPTVMTDDKGSKVIGRVDTARIMDNINNYTTANIITEGKAVTESQLNMALFAEKLIKSYGQNTDKIIRAIKSGSGGSDAKDRYYWQKTENLKNKLKS